MVQILCLSINFVYSIDSGDFIQTIRMCKIEKICRYVFYYAFSPSYKFKVTLTILMTMVDYCFRGLVYLYWKIKGDLFLQ